MSFSLVQDWTSKNVTLNYKGVAIKNQWTTNGDLLSDASGWSYEEIDTNNRFDNYGGDIFADYAGNPVGCLRFEATSGDYFEGDMAYFYQSISIPHGLSAHIATISMDFNYNGVNKIPNGSMYLGIVINGIEANKTIHMNDIATSQWTTLTMHYNPVSFGQSLPGDVTVKYGVYVHGDCTRGSGGPVTIFLDNLKCELWSKPNQSELIRVYDVEFSQNYTYHNTTYGEGYSFIEVERSRSPTDLVVFTIYQNISDVIEFNIDMVTIISFVEKIMNTTSDGQVGSQYTYGDIIIWNFEFSIFIPTDYFSWIIIDKPDDFSFTSIEDGFNVEQIGSCFGTGLGSIQLIIPNSILQAGSWKCEAKSENYIVASHTAVWKGVLSEKSANMTYGDKFLVNVTLNNTISLTNTQINLTICYPNGTIFYNLIREPKSYIELFGNFTVGKNMSVGEYTVITQWSNNLSSNNRDKVGYSEIIFIVWHHSNLTAVDAYMIQIAGDPCLIRVNYTDYDFDTYIDFATVTYNSTFGQSGSMVYIGSGIYFLDLDTSSLGLGDYYFSFNASKSYYQNQTSVDLIHLKIIAQSLALEVPNTVINGSGNDYISCQINVTGAITGTLIWPANISTNWQKPYTVTDHSNGTFTLNFSTIDLPIHGVTETYTVSIYANKTNYGATIGYISMNIHPIPTIMKVNSSIVYPKVNNVVDIKINYTIEGSGMLISNANCSVLWPSIYEVNTVADGFIVRLDTINLSINQYTAIIKLEKEGFETAITPITVIVNYLEFNVSTVNFQDSLDVNIGETITIRIKLTEADTNIDIENATVYFSWDFGSGFFVYVYDGIYEVELEIPSITGSRTMELRISKEGSFYKSTNFSFIISITDPIPPPPNSDLPWYILLIGYILIAVVGILGIFSIRNYVIIPKKRKKESILLAKTQKYKDVMNIEVLLIANRNSGLQIYSKSYSLFQNYKNELLSGFIQAITLVSKEIIGKESKERKKIESAKLKSREKIIEFDFKYFNFLISEFKELRIIFILKEKASERFKEKITEFLSILYSQVSDEIEDWDGDLSTLHKIITPLVQNHFQLYYREEFKINPSIDPYRISKEMDLNKMEKRVFNVISSLTQNQNKFYLEDANRNVHEKNQDKIIEALEMLIEKNIIIASNPGIFDK